MKRTRDSKQRVTTLTLRLRRTRRITAGLVHHHAPAWSTDGRMIASRLGDGADSYWVIVDRKGRVARVLEGPAGGAASFAPDGSLAYSRQVGATSEIWLLPSLQLGVASGAMPRRLLGGDGRLYRDPAYSPDGRFLCYVADDGQAGVGLRLWLLDLLHDDHKVLVPWLPVHGQSSDGGTAARISHPAWSKAGDRLYFEATDGDSSAIYSVSAGDQRIERLTESGYRRPAPLASGLLLCERAPGQAQAQRGGESELVIVDHRQPNRPDMLLIAAGAREPAVVWRKKAALLAWAMPCRTAPDEPSRFDLHVARLIGAPEPPGANRRPPSETSDAEESGEGGTEAQAANPQVDDSELWLERPLPLRELFEDAGDEASRP